MRKLFNHVLGGCKSCNLLLPHISFAFTQNNYYISVKNDPYYTWNKLQHCLEIFKLNLFHSCKSRTPTTKEGRLGRSSTELSLADVCHLFLRKCASVWESAGLRCYCGNLKPLWTLPFYPLSKFLSLFFTEEKLLCSYFTNWFALRALFYKMPSALNSCPSSKLLWPCQNWTVRFRFGHKLESQSPVHVNWSLQPTPPLLAGEECHSAWQMVLIHKNRPYLQQCFHLWGPYLLPY